MKAIILVSAILFGSCTAFAQSDAEVNCNKVSRDEQRTYNLIGGVYYPGSNSDSFFYESYIIKPTSHYPCNGNIEAFTLACQDRNDPIVRTFTCKYGECKNSNGTRTIKVEAYVNDQLTYGDSEGRSTRLRYNRPCDN